MSVNETNMYDVDRVVAEFYDLHETYTDDVELIRRLIGERGPLRVLEPFCGTGRLLIPLAEDGHELVGMDQAVAMLERCRAKTERLPDEVRGRIALVEADVTAATWPTGFDVVVLGGGVSLAGEELFFTPVRRYVGQYVFPPLADSYRIVPAALGEEVVLHGALALAAGERGRMKDEG